MRNFLLVVDFFQEIVIIKMEYFGKVPGRTNEKKHMKEEEFATAVKEYSNEFYRYALALTKNAADAQDAVSEAVLRAYEHRHALKDKTKFKMWMTRILVNTTRTMLRKRERFVPVENVYETGEPVVEQENLSDELWETVLELEPEYREIALLYYYAEFSLKDISKILWLPLGTVKSRLSRAREQLKKLIDMSNQ